MHYKIKKKKEQIKGTQNNNKPQTQKGNINYETHTATLHLATNL